MGVCPAKLRGLRSREQRLRLPPRRPRATSLGSASLLSQLLMLWFQPLVSLGARCPLSAADLWPVRVRLVQRRIVLTALPFAFLFLAFGGEGKREHKHRILVAGPVADPQYCTRGTEWL
ncbi:hypothetical protein PHYPSEUDO_001000 [Phytophthora pseudosyringae]|uniref:Uncharacterized protein n=1 Tax=Phytophthora pseudosyringae TaxID=221518 RepID=A0A8T1W156_9STRA|nr:hypothetical protein PHYPSEUDO_001000 [Phytophthora pseudosyringae]